MSSQRPDPNRPGFPAGFGGTRRMGEFDNDIESMRERMNRDRDAFFRDSPNSAASSATGDQFPFFSRAGPRFDSFNRDRPHPRSPRSFSDRFHDMGNFPEKKKSSTSSDDGNNVCGNSNAFDHRDTIPIKVVHAKPKYEGTRNTTQLPVPPQTQQPSSSSPRLERAHSEPPKTFSQKLNKMANPYTTIPEQDYNLYTSASSPSVPSNRSATAGAPPQVPPRRSTPGSRKTSESEEPAVRHIPIIVEGRDEPVYNRKVSDGGEMKKPSDFYPQSTKKVSGNRTKLDVHQQPVNQEPTSPLSPPPGPIPMGFTPSEAEQPLSPQPIPSGVPIPMSCSPNFMHESSSQDQVDDGAQERVEEAPTPPPPPPPPPPPVAEASSADPAVNKLAKIKEAVVELSARIANFKGSKSDKEYLYLDEMLTRHMLSLDCIDANGRDDIRQMRKDAIRSINRCLSTLDANSKDAADNNAVIDELVKQSSQK